jgi:hypothetical protein
MLSGSADTPGAPLTKQPTRRSSLSFSTSLKRCAGHYAAAAVAAQ